MKATRWKATLCLLAGAMDGATGACLLLAPNLALRLMGVASPPEQLAYLRFIGAFVFAVGGLYLVGWRLARAGRSPEWQTLWLATAWLRLCAGSCVAVLIFAGALSWQWVSVPLSDLGLAAYQFGSGLKARPAHDA